MWRGAWIMTGRSDLQIDLIYYVPATANRSSYSIKVIKGSVISRKNNFKAEVTMWTSYLLKSTSSVKMINFGAVAKFSPKFRSWW